MPLKIGSKEAHELEKLLNICEKLKGEIKDKQDELKRVEASAWEKCETEAKVVRQLVAERSMTAQAKAKRKLFEDNLAGARHALGVQLGMDLPVKKSSKKKSGTAAKAQQPVKAKSSTKDSKKPKMSSATATVGEPALPM